MGDREPKNGAEEGVFDELREDEDWVRRHVDIRVC